ncbi:MAG TPA: hypothetical protein VGC66_23865 [Pyrinomonadaceae bacterium]|jgi:hypothetical protein
MARDESKRLKPSVIESDKDSFAGLKTITNYAPANPDYAALALGTAEARMLSTQQLEAQAEAALEAARDNAVKAEWDYHNLVLGMKDQVVAQYGRDSNEAQTVGRKKTSEFSARKRKPPTS